VEGSVSSGPHGAALGRRVFEEHRRLVIPLVAALVLNVLAYAVVVFPLSRRVANVTDRTEAAERALAAAMRDHSQASGTLTGKASAEKELTTFYTSVLPADLAGARRLTHLRLAQLAQQSGLRAGRAVTDVRSIRESTLSEFKIEMELFGSYADVRTFVHRVEAAPEFVVIRQVELSEDRADNQLQVKVELSTYFRTVGQ
jgi:Tfp pilus assembly protein PilO